MTMAWYRGLLGGRCTSRLLALNDVLAALGDDGFDSRRRAEVPLVDVVGTVNRTGDFDRDFRLVNRELRDRWSTVAAAMQEGSEPPPVELVQLGDLYFVVDGHHRVSVARALGRETIRATVLRICTTAYAVCRMQAEHLAAKAAERRFLQRVPLDVSLRCALWLDRPSDWSRLADAAEGWGFRRGLRTGSLLDRCQLARAWWAEEVMPAVEAARRTGRGIGLPDLQVYLRTQDTVPG
jgi:uncharacterized ParB-like nuclease family protein